MRSAPQRGLRPDTTKFSSGQKQAMKHTIMKKGDNAFLSTFEVEGKTAFQEICSRAGSPSVLRVLTNELAASSTNELARELKSVATSSVAARIALNAF